MSHSTLLFTEPSYLEGFARSIDIGGTMTEFNSGLTPEQADNLALWADWRAVGADMLGAMNSFANLLPELPHPCQSETKIAKIR